MTRRGASPLSPDQWIGKYHRAARQRFTTAQFLLEHNYFQDSMYLAGYVVECAFKALILKSTASNRRALVLTELSSGQESHNFEHLRHLLNNTGCAVPSEVAGVLRKIANVQWTTDWRYEVKHRRSREATLFLEHVKEFLKWVEGRL